MDLTHDNDYENITNSINELIESNNNNEEINNLIETYFIRINNLMI